MKRLITTFILVVSLIFAFGTQIANADLITSSSDPALTGATVIDFESQTMGTYTSITIGDITFSAINNHLRIDNSYQGYNQTGIYLDNGTYGSNGFSSLRIDFNGMAGSAFGFNWGMADDGTGNWNLVAYDASNTVLDSYAPLPNTGTSSAGEFYGIAAAGIDHAILTNTLQTYDWVGIDNFTYNVVPVPGAVLLGVLGLSIAGIKLRKHV